MNRKTCCRLLRIMVLLPMLLLGAISPSWGQDPAPEPPRPALYQFSRKLCPVCRKTEGMIREIQARADARFTLRVLYMDEDIRLFRRYQVAIVPTLIFLDPSGQEVARHEGHLPREKLLEKLRELKFMD